MKALFDLHTHTIASGHAFSTLKENIEEAKGKGLVALGTSDHAESMPGASQPIFFSNYKAIKKEIFGVKILCGIEANILNYEGKIDVSEKIYPHIQYIIASLHTPCIVSGTKKKNTKALIGAMKKKKVKIIGHPDDDRYPLDYESLVKAAKEYDVLLELNNASFGPASGRKNAKKNVKILLEECEKKQVKMIMSSDAHIFYDIGNFKECEKLIAEYKFPKELVANYSLEILKTIL